MASETQWRRRRNGVEFLHSQLHNHPFGLIGPACATRSGSSSAPSLAAVGRNELALGVRFVFGNHGGGSPASRLAPASAPSPTRKSKEAWTTANISPSGLEECLGVEVAGQATDAFVLTNGKASTPQGDLIGKCRHEGVYPAFSASPSSEASSRMRRCSGTRSRNAGRIARSSRVSTLRWSHSIASEVTRSASGRFPLAASASA